MRLLTRFVLWVAAAISLSAFTAPSFPSMLNQSVGDAFGSLFVAIPIVALLTLIFALRWKELVSAMEERSPGSQAWVRLTGAALVGALVALEPLTGQSLGASGVAVVLTFYGVSLIVTPPARRFLLPYAAVYAAAVGAPPLLLWVFGEPLAAFSSGVSARLVSLAGFPVNWQGTQFEFVSKAGGVVSGVVTPSCSSVTSVTMFLGLLALMHLDMKKDLRPTLKLAVLGTVALTLLNSARILIILWVGYQYGSDTLLGVHDWLGYALFLGFFLAVLPIYSRMKGPNERAGGAIGGPASPAGPTVPAVSRAD
jgi:exosortase/archaeosortase family protein